MNVFQILFFVMFALFPNQPKTAAAEITDNNFLEMPAVGANGLRILSPTLLELTLITTKAPDPAKLQQWDFVTRDSRLMAPAADNFAVIAGQRTIAVDKVGFRRRPIYAPLKKRDLRIGNYIYLHLASSIADGESVEVKNLDSKLWNAPIQFRAVADPLRWSPAIHINQEGYCPAFVKKAMVGYFLGSLGEMDLPMDSGFTLVKMSTGKPVFSGKLSVRRDVGYTYAIAPYRQVLEADFSDEKEPGEYRIQIAGLIEAFDQFKTQTRSDWNLVFGGSDWHGSQAIHQAIEKSPFRSEIHSLGFVPTSGLPTLYHAASTFIYPSLYEGFGLPPVEAMACGCPVISSDRGALREVVGDAAALVDPEDIQGIKKQMAILASDAGLREKLREAGLSRAKLFDWRKTAERTFQIYHRALNRHRGRTEVATVAEPRTVENIFG